MMRKLLISMLCLFCFIANAKDYKAVDFGIVANGVTLNTKSIQKAIDYISTSGGGTLIFVPGKYLTGTFYLKSNVTLHLEEGAVILGSKNPFDYPHDTNVHISWKSLIYAIKQKNIGITGKGMIHGGGIDNAMNTLNMVSRGLIEDELKYDRVREWKRPQNIYFFDCQNILIKDITLKDPASWNQTYDQCRHLIVDGIKVDSKSYWNNDGIDIVDCVNVVVRNSFFDAADDAICFKSHDATKFCDSVLVENCTARSSASALKFGTVSRGGFKNITVKNLTVYDTYRSAITFAAVDGGFVENILVDGVRSINTGNVIYLRIGDRWSKGKKPFMKNIVIKNVYAEVPLAKPDAGYSYEGPIEDLQRNISPASIMGLPNYKIENVLLENIEFVYPGGSDPFYASRGLKDKDFESIPEMESAYPEFSQFKELPAWGFYLRHADNITFKNVRFKAVKPDYRPAIVTDKVSNSKFIDVKVIEPETNCKQQIFMYKSPNTVIQ